MRRLLLMLQLLFAQFQTTWGEVVETLARNPGTYWRCSANRFGFGSLEKLG